MSTNKKTSRSQFWLIALALLIFSIYNVAIYDNSQHRHGNGEPHSHYNEENLEKRTLLKTPLDNLVKLEVIVDGAMNRLMRNARGEWVHYDEGLPGLNNQLNSNISDTNAANSIGKEHKQLTGLKAIEASSTSQSVALFSRAKYDRVVAEGEGVELEAYGLKQPTAVLFAYADDNTAPVFQLHIGDVAPDTLSRYVYMPDSQSVMTMPNFHALNMIKLANVPGQ